MVLRSVVPVGDVALGARHAEILELARPGDTIGPGRGETRGIGRRRRDRRLTVAVVEPPHGVWLAVPARIVPGPARGEIVYRVAVRVVGKHGPRMVGDDVQDHIDALIVRGSYEVP